MVREVRSRRLKMIGNNNQIFIVIGMWWAIDSITLDPDVSIRVVAVPHTCFRAYTSRCTFAILLAPRISRSGLGGTFSSERRDFDLNWAGRRSALTNHRPCRSLLNESRVNYYWAFDLRPWNYIWRRLDWKRCAPLARVFVSPSSISVWTWWWAEQWRRLSMTKFWKCLTYVNRWLVTDIDSCQISTVTLDVLPVKINVT